MLSGCESGLPEVLTQNRGQGHWTVVSMVFWDTLLGYWADQCNLPVTRCDSCQEGISKLICHGLREESGQLNRKF